MKFTYVAMVKKVVDADTIDLLIHRDIGFKTNVIKEIRVRLASIDAWEMRGAESPKGKEAKEFVSNKILGKPVIVKTYKDKTGKYGRYIADIWFLEGKTIDLSASFEDLVLKILSDKDCYLLNKVLVESGFARDLDGRFSNEGSE